MFSLCIYEHFSFEEQFINKGKEHTWTCPEGIIYIQIYRIAFLKKREK